MCHLKVCLLLIVSQTVSMFARESALSVANSCLHLAMS